MLFIPDQVDFQTALSATEFNSMLHEIQNVILDTLPGFDGFDEKQVLKSIENYVVSGGTLLDSGAVNAYVVSPIGGKQGPTEYISGSIITFKALNTNSGNSTINVNSLGAREIRKDDGTVQLDPNDIVANQYATVVFDPDIDGPTGVFRLLSGGGEDLNDEFPKGYIGGFSNAGSLSVPDLVSIRPGAARDAADTFDLRYEGDRIEKEFDQPWAAISTDPGMPTGGRAPSIAINPNQWYHVFVIGGPGLETDFGFDERIDAQNLLADTGFSSYRRVGSFKTDNLSNVIPYHFTELSNVFYFRSPIQDASAVPITGTTPFTVNVSTPKTNVAGLSFRCEGMFTSRVNSGASGQSVSARGIGDPTFVATDSPLANNQTAVTADFTTGMFSNISGEGQILGVTDIVAGDFDLWTWGWKDNRLDFDLTT